MHPDFIFTPAQRETCAVLLTRIDAAMAMHAGKAWRVSRIKRLRGGLVRNRQTDDRAMFARWLGQYRLAIETECRFLEDSASFDAEAAMALFAVPVPVVQQKAA